MPEVSILMPVYNNHQFLARALEAIKCQYNVDYELLVINDGSTEPEIEKTLSSYENYTPRMKVLCSEDNNGYTLCLNWLLRNSVGEYIAFQDADDNCVPRRLEKQLKAIKERKLDMLSTYGTTINEKGKRIANFYTDEAQRKPEKEILANLKNECWILGPSMMFARRVFDTIGYFDEELYFAQDYNYWLRAIDHGFKWGILREELYNYRRHKGSVRHQHPELKHIDWSEKARERAAKFGIIMK